MPSRRPKPSDTPPHSAPAAPEGAEAEGPGLRVLKKYPNRRLYDTRSSGYITLADVKQMVLGHEAFEVRDAKTGEDLTRSILLQIILEEEAGGVPMFSAATLAQIIRFHGHSMQGAMGQVLEHNLSQFAEIQKQWLAGQGGVMQPLMQQLMDSYAEQGRKLFEQMQRGGGLFPGMFPPGR
jgi:polyhydroxyalkanoate synthesis repressor PhaR